MTQAAHRPVTKLQRGRAKSLRREMTNAEQKLRRALRGHRFQGLSFRRQTPIGPFIVDFVCHEHRLVIEIDGGQHFGARATHDRRRDHFLRGKGFRIFRFSNLDVLKNCDGVLEVIAAAIAAAGPLPNPPPQAGEGAREALHPSVSPSLTPPLKGGGNKGITSLRMRNSSTAPIPYLPSRAEERDTHKASPVEGEAGSSKTNREGGMAQHTASSKKARPGDGKK